MALTLGRRCSPVHPTRVRRPPQSGGVGSRRRHPITPRTSDDGPHMAASSVPCDHETENTMPVLQKRRGGSLHVPIRAERPARRGQPLPCNGRPTSGDAYRSRNGPLGRNETIRPQDRARSRPLRQRPLNRETLSDRPTPLTIPQRTADHPEQTIERSKHDGQTSPKDDDAWVDDEPLHHEAHRTSASATTTRKPMLEPHTARVIERPGKWNTVAKTHFQSNLSCWTYWYVAGLCRTVLYDVNTVLLQCAPNLLNLLLIYTTNANAAVNLTVTVLHNFKLKRDTIQAKNDFPAQ